jgi:hypothetical protein
MTAFPELLTPQERLDAIAGILAKGCLRILVGRRKELEESQERALMCPPAESTENGRRKDSA